MELGEIEVVSIPVSDQERAKAFYRDTLGFVLLVDESFGPGQQWVQLAPYNGAKTTIALATWFDEMKPGSLTGLVLRTASLEASCAELASRGVAMQEIRETPWGRFAGFTDPDGNGWMLHEGGPGS